ncbi:MAG TPA: lysylphosphatidylglycerol synthase transmembrane domain-containing protein [Gaiellales bacterium]
MAPTSTQRAHWLRQHAAQLIALVLVVGVFGLVLPRVADYGAVWDVISGLSYAYIALLAATAILNLLTFAPPWMAALPGLSFRNSLVMSQASTAASNVMPGGDAIGMAVSYSMLRRWGFRVEQVAIATGAFSVWNVIANVSFAVVGVVLLALGGESDPLLTTAAAIGAVALAVMLVALILILRDESYARRIGGLAEGLANRLTRLLRRAPVTGWDERLAVFRDEAIGLIRRRWAHLTVATLAGHLTVFLVLLVAVRAVGVSSADVSFVEVFAAWSLIRIITTIPVTPGGLGVVELGLTGALVSFGGSRVDVVAGVLLYRVLTYVPPIAFGGICLLVWRRIGGAAELAPSADIVAAANPEE